MLVVEAEQSNVTEASSLSWEVRLRRGGRAVVVQRGIGRFSATALAAEIQALITGEAMP